MISRRGRIGLWIMLVVLSLAVLLLIVIANFDWNRLRPRINAEASAALGREVSIRGDLQVRWTLDPAIDGWRHWVPTPEITANDIQVGNPAWTRQPLFAKVQALHLRIALLPLLGHHVSISGIRLDGPAIDLERDRPDRSNWQFPFMSDAPAAPSAWSYDIGTIGFGQGSLHLVDSVTVSDFNITVTPMQTAIPYDQLVAQDTADDPSPTGGSRQGRHPGLAAISSNAASKAQYQFALEVTGKYQHVPVRGQGHIGAVLALQETDVPFPLQADVRMGDSRISLIGTLMDPVHLGALNLYLRFSGQSMAKLYPLIGVTLPETADYETRGHLLAQIRRHSSYFSYQDFYGRVGRSDIDGSVTYTTGRPLASLKGEVHSHLLRFSDLAPLIGADSTAEKRQRGDASAQPKGKVLPVEPFRTDRWKAMNADVLFVADEVMSPSAPPIRQLSTHLQLQQGALTLDPLHVGVADGELTGTVSLDGGRVPMQGSLQLQARHLKLKQLFPNVALMRNSLGEVNGDLAIKAEGNSVASLLGTADGEVRLVMSDGAISRNLLEMAGLNIGNIVMGKLFGDHNVKINCAAADLQARRGVIDNKLFLLDTPDALIHVSGEVNMRDEKLDLTVTPHTRGIRILTLRSPLYVAGTFKDPSIGVKAGPLILRAAAAIGLGIVAPPAALLALMSPSHDSQEQNTCRATLQQLQARPASSPRQSKSGRSKPAATTATR
ncbi:AsmA family protein [Frateuria aurantia]